MEKWDLLVLLVFPDPQGLLDPQVSASRSSPCLRERRVQILCVEATEPTTPVFATVTPMWTPT